MHCSCEFGWLAVLRPHYIFYIWVPVCRALSCWAFYGLLTLHVALEQGHARVLSCLRGLLVVPWPVSLDICYWRDILLSLA